MGILRGTFSIGLLCALPALSLAADFQVPILELKFFPLDPSGNLDASETEITSTLPAIRTRVQTMSQDTLNALNRSTVYVKDPSAQSSIAYSIYETREFLIPVPKTSSFGGTKADHIKILGELNVCNFVDNLGVKEVWIWMYHTGQVAPVESNMSMGQVSRPFWTHSTHGDISNSGGVNDLPICQKTYTVYDYNYGRGPGEAVHNRGHQLERLFGFADDYLFRNLFSRPIGQTGGVVNGCGNTHFPVNGQSDYDYANTLQVLTNCSDWHPDGSGSVETVNVNAWNTINDPQLGWLVWWMQRMPGRGNNLVYNGRPLRNWWELMGDFDAAMALGGRTLWKPVLPDAIQPQVSMTAVPAGNVSGLITLSAQASDNQGVWFVQFRADGTNIGMEDYAPPYAITLNTALLANGNHTLTALAKDVAGNTRISAPVSINASNPAGPSGNGLSAVYFDNIDFTGASVRRVDATVNFDWPDKPHPSIGNDTFSVRWTGKVVPVYTESYTFYTISDDGARLWVNGQPLVNNWTDHGPVEDRGILLLQAGVTYDLRMEYYEQAVGATAKLLWSSPSQAKEIIPQRALFSSNPFPGAPRALRIRD